MKIGSLEVDIVRKNIKHLYIRVYPPNGQIRIVCPQKLNDATIRQFVSSKTDWINSKRAKFEAQAPKSLPQYITGKSCYFKGDRFLNGANAPASLKETLPPSEAVSL